MHKNLLSLPHRGVVPQLDVHCVAVSEPWQSFRRPIGFRFWFSKVHFSKVYFSQPYCSKLIPKLYFSILQALRIYSYFVVCYERLCSRCSRLYFCKSASNYSFKCALFENNLLADCSQVWTFDNTGPVFDLRHTHTILITRVSQKTLFLSIILAVESLVRMGDLSHQIVFFRIIDP